MSTNSTAIDLTGRIEPTSRWVRGKVGGEFVVDSRRPLLVWEHHKYPTYFFPRADVRLDLLAQGPRSGDLAFWDLTVGERTIERAAYQYEEEPDLAGYLAFRWHKVDRWFEEEEEVFVHARDPYKRVDVMPSSRHVRVEVDGMTVAETERPFLLFETGLPTRYYIPEADVDMAALTATDAQSRCPYKGTASYWSVTVGDQVYANLVWSYPDPIPECPKIAGLLSFFNEKVDLYVDGELQERPQTAWS